MDNKPSLSQYFAETDTPNASQFFDEIGTSPSEMIQSVYLGETKDQKVATDLFSQSVTTSFTQNKVPQEMSFSDVVPTVSQTAALPATSLPDPSTFFDTIGPEAQLAPTKSGLVNPNLIAEAVDGLSIKNQPVDKEADRRRDAWLPSDEALKTLMKAQSSPKGSFFPEREVLTMPGLVLEEELPDALHEIAVKYLGVSSAGIRGVVRADHVTKDEAGLRELIRTGHLRAAINLSGTLLGAAGQGVGRINRPTKHSPRSLQIWLTRFAIMVRLRIHDVLVKEAEPFGDCGKPDMYYQFYPDNYENRSGSLVPFSLRLLLAELPGHVGKPEDAIDRLHAMLAVIDKMLSNLREGKTEDGNTELSDEQDAMESIRLWSGRAVRVQHSIINSAIAMKDYRLASSMMTSLIESSPSSGQTRSLFSALCRLWLLAGHVQRATYYCQQATQFRNLICPTPDVREYVDLGLIDIANGKYQDAYNNLVKAVDQEPTNIMVANNIAVCLLYMGRLKEAILVLQKAIQSSPERGLNDSLLINLCTLYELESSKNMEKKLDLLRMICKHKSDTISNVSECLKLS